MSYQITRNGHAEPLPYAKPFRDASGTIHPWAVIGAWSEQELADIGVTREAAPEPETPTLEQRKAILLGAAREKRWQVETGGIVVNDIPIRTDEGSQSKVANAVAVFDRDPTLSRTKFEAQPNIWVEMTKVDLEAVGVAIGRHIVSVYDRSHALFAEITAATDEATLDAVDINIDWPPND